MEINTKKYLLELGLKEALLNKLSEHQLINMVEFALNHHNSPHLQRDLIGIASLELGGKEGVIELVINDVVTPQQAKSLNNDQVKTVIDTLKNSDITHDAAVSNAVKQARNFILYNQQLKIASITGEVPSVTPYEEEEEIVGFERDIRE